MHPSLVEEMEGDRAKLRKLVADLSDALADEGHAWSQDGLIEMRRRVSFALPGDHCPEWLRRYRSLT